MRAVTPILAAGLALASGACLTGGQPDARGWVVEGAWEAGDVVRLAWTYVDLSTSTRRARLTGSAPIVEGSFELPALDGPGTDWDPPQEMCDDELDPDPIGGPGIRLMWADLIATRPDTPDDLELTQLARNTKASSKQHQALWVSEAITRDSTAGRRFESSLQEGLQIMRRVECRVAVDCHRFCVEPIQAGALVILDDETP